MLRRLIFLLTFLLLMAPLIGRAQRSNWKNLEQVKSGQKVTVVDRHNKYFQGEFLRFSDSDVTILQNKQETTIDRDEVVRVTTNAGHRKRNALIGALAGAGAGLAVGLATFEREGNYGGAVAGSAGGCAGVGAGIGALIPGTKTIYRAAKQNKASAGPPADQSQAMRRD